MTLVSLPTDELEGVIPTPFELFDELPLTPALAARTDRFRQIIQAILNGRDRRKLLIVGPCSIHDLDAAYAYGERLLKLSQQVEDRYFIVMRTYVEKPRTTRGWKGLLYDPHLDGSHDLATGLRLSRKLFLELTKMGIPIGCELLEINTAHYFTDLLSWGCIGARTCTSQPHRQLASSLALPIGFKNTTDGSVENAIHGIISASQPHTYLGPQRDGQITRIQTEGNPHCHIILRGGRLPNYDADSVTEALEKCARANIREKVVIDCSHDNCGKQYREQITAFRSIMRQISEGNQQIAGLMLESHLNGGTQPISESLSYGVSITDPCLDWESTEALILETE